MRRVLIISAEITKALAVIYYKKKGGMLWVYHLSPVG
jgi:hypothetical protein